MNLEVNASRKVQDHAANFFFFFFPPRVSRTLFHFCRGDSTEIDDDRVSLLKRRNTLCYWNVKFVRVQSSTDR